MRFNLLSIIAICFIIACLPFISAASNFPTVTLGPSASSGVSASNWLYINSSVNITYNILNVTYNLTTYDDHIADHPAYNETYESTYNETYDAITSEWLANETAYNSFWYNQTLALGQSSFNCTAGQFVTNVTPNGVVCEPVTVVNTFNDTYDTWLPNWTASNKYWYNMTLPDDNFIANETAYGKYWYNHTSAVEALWSVSTWVLNFSAYSKYWYNQSYFWPENYTAYNKFWYNQSEATASMWNDTWTSTYNVSYDGALNNASYLSIYNESYLYYDDGIFIHKNTTNAFVFNQTQLNQSIDDKLMTIYYNATTNTTVRGTYAGEIQYLQAYDSVSVNITEVAGANGLDFQINFSGVTDLNELIFRYKSSAGESHTILVQIYDCNDGDWENYATLGAVEDYNIKEIGIFDADEHLCGGEVSVRFYQAANGNTGHTHYFDWVTVANGPATPAGTEIDPFSFHKGANIVNNGYNVSADYIFGNISTYNVSYDGSLNNGSYLSTFNTTYDAITLEWIANETAYGKFWYNQSYFWPENYTAYNKYWYNMSDGSYNETYDAITLEWVANETAYGKYWYNQSYFWPENYTAYSKYWYNMSDGSYNATYDALISFNQTLTNETYLIKSGDTMTGFLNMTANINIIGNYLIKWLDNTATTTEAYIYELNGNLDFYLATGVFKFNKDITTEGHINGTQICLTTGFCLGNETANATYAAAAADTWLANETAYGKFWYNQSYFWPENYTAYNKYWYNMTIDTPTWTANETAYGKFWYNQSTGTQTQVNNFTAVGNEFAQNVSIDKSANFGGTSYIRWDGTRLIIGVS